jgi:ABC-type polysaccharide transport system permease subunit
MQVAAVQTFFLSFILSASFVPELQTQFTVWNGILLAYPTEWVLFFSAEKFWTKTVIRDQKWGKCLGYRNTRRM